MVETPPSFRAVESGFIWEGQLLPSQGNTLRAVFYVLCIALCVEKFLGRLFDFGQCLCEGLEGSVGVLQFVQAK